MLLWNSARHVQPRRSLARQMHGFSVTAVSARATTIAIVTHPSTDTAGVTAFVVVIAIIVVITIIAI
ncbi:unnamed protein product [Lampetra fluviatilis]